MEKVRKIYEIHSQWMLALANSILKNYHDSEDVVQRSFEKVIRYRDSIDDIDSKKTKTFLAIIVKSVACSFLKKLIKRKEEDLETVEFLAYDLPDVLDTVLTKVACQKIVEMIKEMSEPDHSILILRLYFEMDFKSIADIVELNDSTVRKRYQRARNKLANILREGGR